MKHKPQEGLIFHTKKNKQAGSYISLLHHPMCYEQLIRALDTRGTKTEVLWCNEWWWSNKLVFKCMNVSPIMIFVSLETRIYPVFCRFVLPCQILLPPIKTVGSTIRQRKILPVKLGFINVYTYQNLKPTLTVMHIQ